MICIALPNIVIVGVRVLQEICDNPEWISSGASRFDVRQGELGKQKVESILMPASSAELDFFVWKETKGHCLARSSSGKIYLSMQSACLQQQICSLLCNTCITFAATNIEGTFAMSSSTLQQ